MWTLADEACTTPAVSIPILSCQLTRLFVKVQPTVTTDMLEYFTERDKKFTPRELAGGIRLLFYSEPIAVFNVDTGSMDETEKARWYILISNMYRKQTMILFLYCCFFPCFRKLFEKSIRFTGTVIVIV